MKRIKFLHFADLHLDSPFSKLENARSIGEIRREDLKIVFNEIIQLVKSENIDCLFIGGDLYEAQYVRKSTIDFIFNGFREIPQVQVVILPGNHDPIMRNSYFTSLEWPQNVVILNGDKSNIYLEKLNTYVYSSGFYNYKEFWSPNIPIILSDNDSFHIALIHGTPNFDFSKKQYNNINTEDLLNKGLDFVLFGHFHSKIDDYDGRKLIYNPGSPEPLGFDELGQGNVLIGEICLDFNGSKTKNIKMNKISNREYIAQEIDISDLKSDFEILEAIKNCLNLFSKDFLIQIKLKGTKKEEIFLDIKKINRELDDKCFYLEIKDETVLSIDYNEMKEDLGLKGVYLRKMLKMIETEQDETKKALIFKALKFGIAALENEKIEI